MLERTIQNLRYGFRQLMRSPGFTTVAVLSLALGIGANTAIFSLTEQILLRPLPVPEPDRLVNLAAPGPKPGATSCNQAGDCGSVFTYPMFRDLEAEQEPFTDIAAHRTFWPNVTTGEQTLNATGVLVSGTYFPVLGVRPVLGRLLDPGDDRAVGGDAVAVLSHDFWQNRMGSDPAVLDRTIIINGHPFTIVGVTPPGFDGATLGYRADLFVPMTMRSVLEPAFDGFDDRRNYWIYLFARLRPGVSIEQAAQAVNRVYRPIIRDVEAPLQSGMTDQTMERFLAREVALSEGRRGQSTFHADARTPLLLLLGITAIVLLIACANVANLLLARGARRSQELAIRGSLGAGRPRLIAQLLTESCLLALIGGAAGLVVAQWTLASIGSFLPPELVNIIQLRISGPAFAFAVAVSLAAGLLFGTYPAVHGPRPDLVRALKAAGGQPGGTRAAARFRTALVTVQITLSMALLVSAGLFIRSLVNVTNVDLGLRPENVVAFDISPELNGYSPQASRSLFEAVEEELAAVPGVSGVTASFVPILRNNSWANDVSVEGFEAAPDVNRTAWFNAVGPGYFATLGIPLLAGREFAERDDASASPVAIVNEGFTKKFGLDGPTAVGKLMAVGSDAELDIEIVGVVADASYNEVKAEAPPMYFTPWRQGERMGTLTFYARTSTDPEPVLAAVRGLVRGLDPDLPVQNLKTLETQVLENVFQDRMISSLAAAFAALATLLAAIGLFGVMAYTVAQRTREIGLRMALGADTREVRSMVLRQVGRVTLLGGLIGIAAALALGRAAQSLLFGIQGHDPVSVVAGAALLAGVALGAGYFPARRAARVDPMIALRAD